MNNIKDLLLDLVSIQSDTGTILELDIANRIYEILEEDNYFKENPNYFGKFEDNDVFQRPVVWGLKKGRGKKTIILTGHYDAVEIESYGSLKPYALNPKELKEKLKELDLSDEILKNDLKNDNWQFGRGIADMKAGIAINLHTLFNFENKDVNILFTAVPDEENMSSGAIQSVKLYEKLQKEFDLEYELSIISEPQMRNADKNEDIIMYSGTMGKILPVILAKGVLTHSGEIFRGLNSSFIISEVVHNLELTTDMISSDRGTFTQPPTVQIMKDLKTTYDVSIPEYSVACLNILFLKNKHPNIILEELKTVCEKSLNSTIERYNKAFDFMMKQGFHEESNRKNYNPKVITINQLESMVEEKIDNYYEIVHSLNESIKENVLSKKMNLQDASIHYIKSLLEMLNVENPMIVIGIAPPYYPSVSNAFIGKNIDKYIENLDEFMKENSNIGVNEVAYLSGMDDMSYMSCTDPKQERELLKNLTVSKDIYDIPVESISKLNIPCFMIGPACRSVHQMGERVYIPDVVDRIPKLFFKIIENMEGTNE